MPLWEHGAWGLRYGPNAGTNTRMAPRAPFHWGWGFEVFRYLPYVARYSRGQVAISWGGGLVGIFPGEVGLKLSALAAAGISEILPEAGVYRRHFARAAFGIRADGFPKAGARRNQRRVDAVDHSSHSTDHAGPAGVVVAVAKRPYRPRRATWTKCHDRDGFRERLRHVTFQKKLGPPKTLKNSWVRVVYT